MSQTRKSGLHCICTELAHKLVFWKKYFNMGGEIYGWLQGFCKRVRNLNQNKEENRYLTVEQGDIFIGPNGSDDRKS